MQGQKTLKGAVWPGKHPRDGHNAGAGRQTMWAIDVTAVCDQGNRMGCGPQEGGREFRCGWGGKVCPSPLGRPPGRKAPAFLQWLRAWVLQSEPGKRLPLSELFPRL